jgi:hypothetical protein
MEIWSDAELTIRYPGQFKDISSPKYRILRYTKLYFTVGLEVYVWVMISFFASVFRLARHTQPLLQCLPESLSSGLEVVCFLRVLPVHKMYAAFTIRLPYSVCLCTDATSAYLIELHCSRIIINGFIVVHLSNPYTLQIYLSSVCMPVW